MPSQGPSTLPCHPCRCRHSLPLLLLLLLCRLTTAFLSAFLDNVTTILLMAPVTISLMRQCNTDPVPLLLAQVRTQSIPTLARQTAWAGAAQRSAAQCSANGWGQPRCCGSFARPPLLPSVCTCQHQPPLVSDSLKGGAKLFHCRPFCQTLAAQVCAQLCLSTCGHASSCVCGMPLHLSRPAPLCTHSLTHLLRWFFVALVPACSHDGGRPSGAHHR